MYAVAAELVSIQNGSHQVANSNGITAHMKDKLGVDVEASEIRKIQRGVKAAKDSYMEDFSDGFACLKSYLEELKEKNDCLYALEQTPDGRLSRYVGSWLASFVSIGAICNRCFFMALAQVEAFLASKPIISFDGGHLKRVQWGNYQILLCVSQDGENRDVLVSLAVVPTESKDSYEFLISNMKKNNLVEQYMTGDYQKRLLIITDRAKVYWLTMAYA